MPDVRLVGLGTALPVHSLSTDEYIKHAKQFACATPRQEKVLEELYRRTAIAQRASVLTGPYGEHAEEVFVPAQSDADRGPSTGHRMRYYADQIGALAKRACDAAFAAASVAPAEITHVVTVSCTGFNAPGFDIELVHSIPLSRSVQRTHVGFMGCHGGMNGLRVASAYCAADPKARVLLCAAEACSLHFQYGWGTDRLVANSLFADGAAAAILAAGRGSQKLTSAPTLESALLDSASFIIPDSLDQMLWRIGDNGFEMHLAATVPALIEQWLPRFIRDWLGDTRVDEWVVHPGGPKILDAVQESLALPASALEASREVLALCGNMSSPTVFFILDKLRARGAKGKCVMLGFGPGLTVEAALLDL